MSLTIDEDTCTLTLLEEGQPPRTLTVDPEHWHLNQRRGHLRFGAEAAGLTLKGALHVGQDGRVGGYLKLREGEQQKSRYALTARPTPSGPAGLFYIHTDHLGTPQSLTDETQQVVWAADYQPFGEATLTKDNVSFNLRFPGQYFGPETGLYYNYFRDYDPTIGRYIQSDPIRLDGGINTYAYALNNPLSYIDRDGQQAAAGVLSGLGSAASAGAEGTAAASGVVGVLGPAVALAGSGLGGYGLGNLIYPHIAEPLGDAIDAMCRDGADESCEEEWERAFEICEREIAKDVNRGITGGYKDLYSCVRGLVSQRCGGNKVID